MVSSNPPVNISFLLMCAQASKKLDEQQLASLSSEKAVSEYLESERENIANIIKQMLAVGEIFKRENLQVNVLSIRLLYDSQHAHRGILLWDIPHTR